MSGRLVDLFSPTDLHLLRLVAMGQTVDLEQLGSAGRMLCVSSDGHTPAEAFNAHIEVLPALEKKQLLKRLHGTGTDAPRGWPEPEDRGLATRSPLGDLEYAEDLVRPSRIIVWAAEEGSGKSYTVDQELGIRIARAGGKFAGTWQIMRTGPVLVLGEMHPDDDYEREDRVLAALGLDRSDLAGRYYRLSLMTAADGAPVLAEDGWREWIVGWCQKHGVILLVFDTATGATQVDPWGREIQTVYRNLRLMLDTYPELAIVLIVHCKKPNGHGERRISDVIGEWGRWCDVVVMQELDGTERVKLATYKRVRGPRRILATRADGLLVEPKDITGGSGPKVPLERVVAVVQAEPGLSGRRLGQVLQVATATAMGYLRDAEKAGQVILRTGPKRAWLAFPATDVCSVSNSVQRDD
jgi:hypothetical protein